METVIEVIGVNGDQMILAGEETGVDGIWLASELTGFYDPEIQAVTKRRANRPGAKFVSHRILERTVIFKVSIENGKGFGNTWRERDARWRRLWEYDDYSTIRVTTDEGTRNLAVRLQEIEVDTRFDPHVNEVTDITMTVVADDPFWYAPPLIEDVVVNKGAGIKVLRANPTGNPIFPVWVLEAPGTWKVPNYEFKKDGTLKVANDITLPKLNNGEHLLVNTDPAVRQLTAANDANVWGRMNGVRFSNPIPPGTGEVEFWISTDSSTPKQAQLRLERPYIRPWGRA